MLLAPWLGSAAAAPQVLATDVAEEAGLDFVHAPARMEVARFPDFTGGGACWGDHDQDGRLDLFLPDGLGPSGEERSRLYQNDGPDYEGVWRFRDVTDENGIDLSGIGQGCVWGDYDNDGRQDLFVTFATMAGSPQGHTLLRNLGPGRGFEDVTVAAGMDLKHQEEERASCRAVHRSSDGSFLPLCFGVSAAWLDFDLDGDLDLYVGNYVEVPHGNCRYTAFPNPTSCQGQANHLWRNEGDGTFIEIGLDAGVAYNSDRSGGRTLGVVATDIDGDGWPDLYAANDYDANALYLNRHDGTFGEVAVARGVDATGNTFLDDSRHRAGMGIDAQDLDDDGDIDLLSTHLRGQYDAVYMGEQKGGTMVWEEVAGDSDALTTIARTESRWGGGFVDLDLDGWKDYLVVAGHQYNHAPGPIHLARQEEGRFALLEAPEWPFGEDAPDAWRNHRGAAFADYDDDGDMDVLVGVLRTVDRDDLPARPRLLRFDVVRETGTGRAEGPHYLRVVLEGTDATRDAYGAHVLVETTDGQRQHLWRSSGGSYGSGHDPRLLFGLGQRTEGTVTVTWPGGHTQGPVPFDVSGTTGTTLHLVEENRRPPPMPAWVEEADDGTLRWGRSMAADFAAYRVYADGALVAERTERDTTQLSVEGPGPYRVTVVDTAGHESVEHVGADVAALPGFGLSHLVVCGVLLVAVASRRGLVRRKDL